MRTATLLVMALLLIGAVAAPVRAQTDAPETAAAADRSPLPRHALGLGVVAGLEEKPGRIVALEPSFGRRVGASTSWHVRGLWSLRTAQNGGTGAPNDSLLLELRTGPARWWCGTATCAGVSAEAGVQYLQTEPTMVDPGEDRVQRDYAGVVDVRGRVMFAQLRPVLVEASLGLRGKRAFYTTGDVPDAAMTYGVGVILGLAASAAF